jgi:hypothetical protein
MDWKEIDHGLFVSLFFIAVSNQCYLLRSVLPNIIARNKIHSCSTGSIYCTYLVLWPGGRTSTPPFNATLLTSPPALADDADDCY